MFPQAHPGFEKRKTPSTVDPISIKTTRKNLFIGSRLYQRSFESQFFRDEFFVNHALVFLHHRRIPMIVVRVL